jgi:hypothetical protein
MEIVKRTRENPVLAAPTTLARADTGLRKRLRRRLRRRLPAWAAKKRAKRRAA